jgi:tetratricopeptide (TPR) repeat protein
MHPAKKIIFTFIAIIFIPSLFFGLLELALRLMDIGNSYDYFNEIEIDGNVYYQDNKYFGNQFYPSSLGVAPLHNTMSSHKDDKTIRVLILGGSAAQGFPHLNHGLDRHLSAHLKSAIPDKKIEVINTAMTSINSHVVYEVARTLPEKSADYAVVLMGNNEVVGPYGPSTFSQNFLSSLTVIRSLQALKRTHTWQAVSQLVQLINLSGEETTLQWEGMQMFSDFSVKHDDTRLKSVYNNYESNLRDSVKILQDKGMHVILSSVPVNLRHSAPFGSIHKEDMTQLELARWKSLEGKANDAFQSKNWKKAEQLYIELLTIDSEYADTHFRLATVFENIQEHERAKAHYLQALNFDTKRFRANHIINNIVSNVADTLGNKNISYVDNAAVFDEVSNPYAPGWNLFHEHVHFDYSGNYYLAREFTRAIMSDLSPGKIYTKINHDNAKKVIGFPNYETKQVMTRLISMVQNPPFTYQSNSEELIKQTITRKDNIDNSIGSPKEVIERRQDLIDKNLADWKIHYELAELNQFLRNNETAYFHSSEVIKLYPYNFDSYIKKADYLASINEHKKAIQYLKKSLNYLRDDHSNEVLTLGKLGLNYIKDGQYNKGKEYLENIIENYPNFIGANFRSFGILIKIAKQRNLTQEVNSYVSRVEEYANSIINNNKVNDFPLLYKRMAQLMTMANNDLAAKQWQLKHSKLYKQQ